MRHWTSKQFRSLTKLRYALGLRPTDILEAMKVIKRFGKGHSAEDMFYNLCFCLCAPQTKFVNNKKVNEELQARDYYHQDLHRTEVEKILTPVRFYSNKTEYLVDMKYSFATLWAQVITFHHGSELAKREHLVASVRGLGYKTASHFLRNLGATDLAIIDTHVLTFLSRYCNYKVPKNKTLTPKMYFSTEELFRRIATEAGLNVAELDALVWKAYSKTDWKEFTY